MAKVLQSAGSLLRTTQMIAHMSGRCKKRSIFAQRSSLGCCSNTLAGNGQSFARKSQFIQVGTALDMPLTLEPAGIGHKYGILLMESAMRSTSDVYIIFGSCPQVHVHPALTPNICVHCVVMKGHIILPIKDPDMRWNHVSM